MSKRTTFTPDEDDYLTLEREAERRGVPVAHVLREAVAEYVAHIRVTRLPSMGYASGAPGLSQESVDDEYAPLRHAFEVSSRESER